MSLCPTSASPSGTGRTNGDPPLMMRLCGVVTDHDCPLQRSKVSAVQNDGTVARTRMITWFDRDARRAVSSVFEKPRNPPTRVAPLVDPACAGWVCDPESPVRAASEAEGHVAGRARREQDRARRVRCGQHEERSEGDDARRCRASRRPKRGGARPPKLIEFQMQNRPHRPAASQRMTKIPNDGVRACAAATAMSVAEPASVNVRSRRAGTSKA